MDRYVDVYVYLRGFCCRMTLVAEEKPQAAPWPAGPLAVGSGCDPVLAIPGDDKHYLGGQPGG